MLLTLHNPSIMSDSDASEFPPTTTENEESNSNGGMAQINEKQRVSFRDIWD